MRITEYADVLNVKIDIKYYPNQGCRWTAKFKYAETKEDKSSGILKMEYGNGDSPQTAIEDYVRSIRGKVLVFDANGGDKRREYVVPDHIEA